MCSENHEALKLDNARWTRMHFIGFMRAEDDGTPSDDDLELRNCTCGTTLGRKVK